MAYWSQKISGSAIIDGALFTVDVGFQSHAVVIDNYTPFYLYLKDAEAYIAPYWVGAIRVITHATDYAYVQVASPFGPQTPVGTSFFVNLVWSDDPQIQQTPGSSIANAIGPPGVITSDTLNQYTSNVFTVGLAPIAIPIVYTTDRRAVLLQSSKFNNPLATIFIGDSGVTANDGAKGGIQLSPGMSYPMDLSQLAVPYAVTDIASRPFDATVGQRLIVAEAR